jgi:hypothetical protein
MRAPHLVVARPRPHAGPVVLVVLAVLASLVLALTAATPARALPADEVDSPTMPADCFGPAQTAGEPTACTYSGFKKKRPTVVLWGDSHAWMYIPALRQATRGRDVNFVSFVAGSCPPIATNSTPATGYSGKCERSNVNALRYVKRLERRGSEVRVLLGSNWSGFRMAYRRIALEQVGVDAGYDDYTRQMVALSHEGTPRLFQRLGRLGVDVDVIAQAATIPDRVLPCAAGDDPYACEIPRWRALPEERRTESWLRSQMDLLTGDSRYITPTDAYCNSLVCGGNVGGIFTWYDPLHLSATRTKNLASYFAPTIRALTRR